MPAGAIFTYVAALVGMLVAGLVLWQIFEVVLLVFGGVLIAVLWRNFGVRLARLVRIPDRAGTIIVILLNLMAVGVLFWIAGPLVADQMDQLFANLTDATAGLQEEVRRYGWGRWVFDEALPSLEGTGTSGMLGRVTGAFSSILGVLGNVVLVLMVALYTAAAPAPYRQGFVSLFPSRYRDRADEVLQGISRGLWHWLLGQFVAMFGVGLVTTLGLWFLDIPLAFVLGILAGLLNFIPLLGPVLAAIPALLVGFSQSPVDALSVGILFLGVQQLEGNVLTPLAQHRAVSLPPAVILVSVIGFGVLFGPLGVLLATPLAVVVTVIVKMLYIENVLGEKATDLP